MRARNTLLISLAIVAVVMLGLLWLTGLLPSSLDEALFRYRLSQFLSGSEKRQALRDIGSFDWDLVCDNHPYRGPRYVAKYDRTYQGPIWAAHDGVWVLLFIDHKGNPKHFAGSCNISAYFGELVGCVSKDQAVVDKIGVAKKKDCTELMVHAAPSAASRQ